jgi:hypothetical protein
MPMIDPDKYWPAWLLDFADQRQMEIAAKVPVSAECLPDGCVVYKPDWTARARRGHWVRAKLAQ